MVTFEDLSKVSPELVDLQKIAQEALAKDDGSKWKRYEFLKSKLRLCVGFGAKDGLPEYCYTAESYDVAHKAVFGGVI